MLGPFERCGGDSNPGGSDATELATLRLGPDLATATRVRIVALSDSGPDAPAVRASKETAFRYLNVTKPAAGCVPVTRSEREEQSDEDAMHLPPG